MRMRSAILTIAYWIWEVLGPVITVELKQQIALFGSGLSQKIIPAVSDLKGRS
jgi:hypothetical protein